MSGSTYLVVTFEMDAGREEELAEVLARHEAPGCELRPDSDQRLVVAVYPKSTDEGSAAPLFPDLEALAAGEVRVESHQCRDWLAAYRESLTPFTLGRTWWIDPSPERPTPAPDRRRRLVVEPRMAFGSGSHASTHLVLLELEDDPPSGRTVLDIGTGSGILSLACEMLGAAWTIGLDIDMQAVCVAKESVSDQDCRCAPAYLAGPLDAVAGAEFELVLCNMLTSEFLPLLPGIRGCLGDTGVAVFSGILAEEQGAVEAALAEVNLVVVATRRREEWVAIRARSH